MKIRMMALAGVAAVALAGPASASDATGWYGDLSGGWDSMGDFKVTDVTLGESANIGTKDTALVTGAFGYRFQDRLRLEGEIGWDTHGVESSNYTGITGGHAQVTSFLANAAYDVPLSQRWDFSFGGGVGAGQVNWELTDPSGSISSTQTGFMWQGFAGVAYSLSHNVDLTLDFRYRQVKVSKEYVVCVDCEGSTTLKVTGLNEEAVMVGIRWYLESAPPPPPPPPAPLPPPPAPMAPPPVKTFVVFFDFNKSDLTAEALTVVQEAVKVAKSNGFVKVMVTGHTDTVGSDSYNQGLSVRRAETVKDEMTREGMDGSTISIEGKSFHDPLVPTGPDVREPQNRRAVIDLGG
jgi:outer membrane protein OmpA-like peptidoglycan-associated protein